MPFFFANPVRDSHSGLSIPEAGCVNARSPPVAVVRPVALPRSTRILDTGRWRSDPSGDLGRISRQQEFIRRVISVAVSKGLSNPAKLNSLVNVGVDYVGLDPTLGITDLLRLGKRFAVVRCRLAADLQPAGIAVPDQGGAAVLDLKEREAEPILNVFRGLDPSTP